MAINLKQLEKTAARYKAHKNAYKEFDQNFVETERKKVAERHRQVFLPAAERLISTQSSIAQYIISEDVQKALATKAIIVPPSETRPATVVINEILQRDNDLRPIRFLQLGLLVARSVGRIRISDGLVTEEGDATGFLVAPGLLLTNAHVLSNYDTAAAGTVIFDDEEELNGLPKQTSSFRLRPDLLFVNDEELDYAFVGVDSRTANGIPLAQFGYLRLFEETGKINPTQRQTANIIQHPRGGRKKIAFRDNYIDDVIPDGVDPNKKLSSLFYGTDTLKGSSGSPVCSDQWFVVALHRGGVAKTTIIDGEEVVLRLDGTIAEENDPYDLIRYETNEGTRISRIYHSLRNKAEQNNAAGLVLKKIRSVANDPRRGPIELPTNPIHLPTSTLGLEGGIEEISRRRRSTFDGAVGFRPDFLGGEFIIPLPTLTSEVQNELANLKDSSESELKYANFSVFMNKVRRTAFFIAGNVDGKNLWGQQGLGALPRRPNWGIDPRMNDEFQPDDEIFSNTIHRGHLFKREDAVWGDSRDSMKLADKHSFSITNASPMIANFNNVEWGDLEDIITRESAKGNRITYFAGPIFRSSDRFYNELRSNVPLSEIYTGMRVPESFWKIVAWVDNSTLKAAGFILHQSDEIQSVVPILEEINFEKYESIPIPNIQSATGLLFPTLLPVDTFNED